MPCKVVNKISALVLVLFVCASVVHAQVTISGTVYTDLGITNIGSAKTVSVSINGAAIAGSNDTDGSGNYSITGLTIDAGDVLTLFLDDEPEDGVTVTVGDGANLVGIDIYQDTLIVRHDNAGAFTQANLDTSDNLADADITTIYSAAATTTTLTGSLFLNSTTDFVTADATLTVSGALNQSMTFNGNSIHSLTVSKGGGTLTLADDQYVSGDWVTPGSNTINFGTTTTNLTGAGNLTPGVNDTFHNLVINSGGSNVVNLTNNSLDVGNNFTVVTGIFDTGRNFNVTGTLTVSAGATLVLNGGEIITLGAVSYDPASTVRFNYGPQTIINSPIWSGTFGNLTFLHTNDNVYSLPDTTVNVAGELLITGGVEVVLDDDKTVTVGSLTVGGNCVLESTGTADLVLGGNVNVYGDVRLNSSGGGIGDPDTIVVSSSSPGTRRQWTIFSEGYVQAFDVDVIDQETSSVILAYDSTDSGNNVNWTFSSGITLTGSVYSDEGITKLAAVKNLSVSLKGTGLVVSGSTDVNGDFTLNNVPISSGEVFAIFLDDEIENGLVISRASTSGAVKSPLSIYQDYLVIDTSTSINVSFNKIYLLNPSSDPDFNAIYDGSFNPLTTPNGVGVYVTAGSAFAYTFGISVGTSGDTSNFIIDGYANHNFNAQRTSVFGDLLVPGVLAITTTRPLDVYGDITNSGTVSMGGALYLRGTNQVINDTTNIYPEIVSDTQAKTLTVIGTLTTSGNFTNSQNLIINGGALQAAGNVTLNTSSSVTGTGTLEFSGSSYQEFWPPPTLDINLLVNKTTQTVIQRGASINMATAAVTIRESAYHLNGRNLLAAGGIVVEDNGTFQHLGSETYTIPTLQNGSIFSWSPGSGGLVTTNPAITTYHHVSIFLGGSRTLQFADTDITINGNLDVFGTTIVELDDDKNITILGDTNFTSTSSLTAQGTGDVTLGGNLNVNGGTFTLNSSGGNLGGGDADTILVRSSSSGVQRSWSGGGTFSLTDVDIQDMNNTTGSTIYATSSTDSGNNTNFVFSEAFWGTVYQSDRTTPIGSAKTISYSVNGGAVAGSAETDVNGEYLLTGVSLSAGDIVTVFIDDETENGVTVTEVSGTGVQLDIYQEHLSVNHHNAGSLTNTDLALADNSGDADISAIYTEAAGDITVVGSGVLYVVGSYAPDSATTSHDIVFGASGTYAPGANTTTVTGSWTGTDGTLTAGTGAVNFTATSGTETINEDDSFYNLSVNDGGGTATIQLAASLSVSNDLTILDGILDTDDANDYSIVVGRDLLQTGGQLQANDSTVTVSRSASFNGAETSNHTSRSSLILDGTGNLTVLSGGRFLNVTVGLSGNTTTAGGTIGVNGVLAVGTGGLAGGAYWQLAGTSPLSFTPTSTLTASALMFDLGGGVQQIPELVSGYDANISCRLGVKTCQQVGNVEIIGGHHLLIQTVAGWDATWDTNGFNLTVPGNIVVGFETDTAAKTLNITNSDVFVGGDFTVSSMTTGTAPAQLISTGSTVTLNGNGPQAVTLSGEEFSSLVVNNTSGAGDVTFNDAVVATQTVSINDGQVVFGAADFTIQDAGATGTALTLAAGTTLTNTGTGNLTLGGDVSNAGAINFDSSGGGSGDADGIQIRSTSGGTQRNWQGSGTFSMTDVDVQDQTAIGGMPASINASSSTNLGNNTNWLFDGSILTATAVSLSNYVVDQSASATVSLTNSNPVPANGRIVVSFPAGFDISGVTSVVSTDIDGTLSVQSISGQTITILRAGGSQLNTGTAVSDLAISGVVNPGTSGVTGVFSIETQENSGATIDTGSALGVSILPNSFTLSGVVRDTNGDPLNGVLVSGGALGTRTTDSSGIFNYGSLTAGTSYSLTFTKTNYGFSPTTGTLNSDTNLIITGTQTGSTITGRVSFSNLERGGVAGVALTDGVVSTVSGADGTFSLSGVSDGSQVYAQGAGYKFSKYQVASNKIDFLAEPALNTTSYAGWNTFLQMSSILELGNNLYSDIDVSVTLRNSDGSIISSLFTRLASKERRDIILNTLVGEIESYGVVEVSSTAGAYYGKVVQYKLGDDGRSQFAYSLPLANGMSGSSGVPYNSYNPSTASEDTDYEVANWLTLMNLSSSAQLFEVKRFRSDGVLVSSSVVFVANNGRIDVEGGHEHGPEAGFHLIEPFDPSATYLSFSTRYGEIGTAETGISGYSFASSYQAVQPSQTRNYLSVEHQTWLEITNISDYLEEISLAAYNDAGDQVHRETFGLPGRTQRHFALSPVLNGPGYVRITTVSGRQVMVHKVNYYSLESGRVSAVSSTVGEDVFGLTREQMFNSFLDTGNWLKITNITESFQDVSVGINSYRLEPQSTILLPINSSPDSYGQVEVTGAEHGSILSEVVRTGGATSLEETPDFAH